MFSSHIAYEQQLDIYTSIAVLMTYNEEKMIFLATALDGHDDDTGRENATAALTRRALQQTAGWHRYLQAYVAYPEEAETILTHLMLLAHRGDAAMVLCPDVHIRQEVWRVLNVQSGYFKGKPIS